MKRNGRKSLAGALARAKNESGFTLVELIVVIAILGILAGVGTVGYSGYIKKANMAADEILLDSLNTAYAAACIENGVDVHSLTAAQATATIDGTITPADYQDEFDKYYEGGSFKVITALKFMNGRFVNADGSAYSNLVFDADAIAAVKASAFWTAEGLGVNNLMGKVDYITGLAASLADGSNGVSQMLLNYNGKMFEDLGIQIPNNFADLSEPERAAIMAPLYNLVDAKIAVLETQGIKGFDEMTADEKSQYAQNEILANYAVLDAAKQMKNQDAGTVLSTIKSTSNFTDLIKNSEDGVSQAAAAYGLYTAYAYSIEDATEREAAIAAANDPVNLLKAMDDTKFREYLDTDEAETDLAGYMAAMEMVDSSASDEDAVYSLMVNGFTDPALLAVIQQAMK